jgi:outer membrane lipoprotein carrier protein
MQASRAQGTLYLKRPGLFRWDYHEPYAQQIIADGRQVWLYDPELEQVSVQSQKNALKGTPALLLSGKDPVEQHFEVVGLGNRMDFDWVELIPRDEESQFIRIQLAFAESELRRMEMSDKLGQVTRFTFFDIVRNPELSKDLFIFDPPEGHELFEF